MPAPSAKNRFIAAVASAPFLFFVLFARLCAPAPTSLPRAPTSLPTSRRAEQEEVRACPRVTSRVARASMLLLYRTCTAVTRPRLRPWQTTARHQASRTVSSALPACPPAHSVLPHARRELPSRAIGTGLNTSALAPLADHGAIPGHGVPPAGRRTARSGAWLAPSPLRVACSWLAGRPAYCTLAGRRRQAGRQAGWQAGNEVRLKCFAARQIDRQDRQTASQDRQTVQSD